MISSKLLSGYLYNHELILIRGASLEEDGAKLFKEMAPRTKFATANDKVKDELLKMGFVDDYTSFQSILLTECNSSAIPHDVRNYKPMWMFYPEIKDMPALRYFDLIIDMEDGVPVRLASRSHPTIGRDGFAE